MSEPSDRLREQFGDIDVYLFDQLHGTTRFLVDHERLLNVTRELGGSLVDPLKSTVVHEQRSMGTWVVRKRT